MLCCCGQCCAYSSGPVEQTNYWILLDYGAIAFCWIARQLRHKRNLRSDISEVGPSRLSSCGERLSLPRQRRVLLMKFSMKIENAVGAGHAKELRWALHCMLLAGFGMLWQREYSVRRENQVVAVLCSFESRLFQHSYLVTMWRIPKILLPAYSKICYSCNRLHSLISSSAL